MEVIRVAMIIKFSVQSFAVMQEEDRLRDALRFANACGALTVTERGAIPALPTREAVLSALMKSVA